MSSAFVFYLDTSALLHSCGLILDIAEKQKLQLMAHKVVLDELDRIKDDKNHSENKNAHKVIQSICGKIKIDNNQCQAKRNDDIIIEAAKAQSQIKREVFILTQDKTFKIKFKNSLQVCEFVERFECYKDNIPNEITKRYFEILESNLESKEKIFDVIKNKDFKVNAYNTAGFTPLILSIKRNDIDSIKLLLQKQSIDINKHDCSHLKMTPLAHATQLDNINIIKLLLNNGALAHLGNKGKNRGNTPFLIAAWDNKRNAIAILEELLKCGISINQVEGNGYSALIKASIKGHKNIVEWLLQKGADKSLRSFNSKTALDYAMENKHKVIIQMLDNK